jgi:hypothetical protein
MTVRDGSDRREEWKEWKEGAEGGSGWYKWRWSDCGVYSHKQINPN